MTFGPNTAAILQLNGKDAAFSFLANDAALGTPIIEAATGPSTLTVSPSSPSTFAGTLRDGATGPLGLTKSGASTLTLTGSNSFTGNTIINGGTLYEVTTSGPILVNNGGNLNPGTPTTPGTLTAANPQDRLFTNAVAGTGTATLSFRLNGPPGAGGPGNDFIDLSNVSVAGLSASLNRFGGTTIFNLSGGLGLNNGTYTLIQGNSTAGSVTGVPTLGTIPPGTNVVLTNIGTAITATVTLIPTSRVWSGLGGDANWKTAANWVGGVAPSGNNGETLIFASGAAAFLANNDFADGTSFAAVSVTSGGYLLTGNSIALANSPTAFNVNTPSGATTVNLAVGGTGAGLSANTPGGAITLSGLNTYTGPTTIVTGTLIVSTLSNGGQPSNLGASTSVASNLVLNSNTIFLYTGPATSTDRLLTIASGNVTFSSSGSGALTFSNPGTIAFAGGSAAHTLTFTGTDTNVNTFTPIIPDSAAVSGISTVVKNGSGSWYFAGANTYTGTTTVNSGTFGISGGNDRLPTNNTVIFTNNSTFDLGANAQTVAGITLNDGAFTVNLNSAAGTPLTTPLITFAGTASGNTTVLSGGNINFSPTGLTIDASGFATAGNTGQNKTIASSLIGTGVLTVNAFGDNSDSGGGGPQRLVLSGTSTFTGNINIIRGMLYWTSDDALGNTSNGLILSSGTSGLLFPESATVPATRMITLSGQGDRLIRGYGGKVEIILGPIVGTGNLRLTDGAQVLLGSTSNTYSGATIIANNTNIGAMADNTFSPNSQIQFFSGGATLNTNDHSITVASISGPVTNGFINIGNGVLSTGGDSTSTTYGGLVNGAGTFNKQGTGSLTLTNASAFSGAVNVSAGVLIVDGAITGGGTTAIAGGATLAGKGTLSGTITSAPAAVVAPGDLTGATPQGTLNVGSLTLVPSSNLNIRLFGAPTAGPAAGNDFINATGAVDLGNASLSVTGPSGFAAGTYRIISAGSVSGTLLPVSVPSGFKATVSVGANTVDLVIAMANTSFTWTGNDSNTSNSWMDGGNWVGGSAPSGNAGETLIFPDGVNSFTPQNNFPSGTGFTAITIASGATPYVITGNSIVLGSGNSALTNTAGTNSIKLDLTLNNVTIAVSAGTLNVGQTSNVLNNNSSLMSMNNAGTLVINSVITGSGGLTQDTGAGVTTLNGANTYGGLTTITNGTIQLGNASALGSAGGSTTIAATGTLDLNGQTIAETFTAVAGTITNSNAAAATITGAFTNGVNFAVNGTGAITLNTVSGGATFQLTKSGANTLTLAGNLDNSFLGLTSTAGTTILAKSPSTTAIHAIGGGLSITGAGTIVRLGGTGGDQIYDLNSVSIDTGATLDVNGLTEAIDGLNGLGAVDNSAVAGGTLTIGSNNITASFTGILENTNGTLSLTKIGTGTQTIGNTGSSFSGTLTVSAGDLTVTGSNAIAAPTTSTLGSTTVAHNVVVGGTGILEFTAANVLGSAAATAPAITLVLNSKGRVENTSGDTNILGPIKFNGGTLLTGATSSATSQSYVFAGPVTVAASSTITPLSGPNNGVHLAANSSFNVTDVNSNLIIGVPLFDAANAAGAGSLTKIGPGTLSIFANGSYTGPTTVTAGNLAIAGVFGATDVTVASGANLVVGGNLPVVGNYYNIQPINNNGNNGDAHFDSYAALYNFLYPQTPAVVQTIPATFDFNADGSGFPPPYNVNSNNNEELYSGFITIKTAGIYFIGLASDDGSAAYIDGTIVTNNNFFQGYGLYQLGRATACYAVCRDA